MSKDDTALFCILVKVVSKDLVSVLAILAELFNTVEDPYFLCLRCPRHSGPTQLSRPG